MNYDFNSIESLLRSGVSADEIAQAFTKNLNDAIDTTKRDSKRIEVFENLSKSWNAALEDWMSNNTVPDPLTKEDLMMEPEHAEDLFNQIMELVAKLAPLFKAFEDLAESITPAEKPAPVKVNTVAKPKNEGLNTDDFDLLMRSFLDSIK